MQKQTFLLLPAIFMSCSQQVGECWALLSWVLLYMLARTRFILFIFLCACLQTHFVPVSHPALALRRRPATGQPKATLDTPSPSLLLTTSALPRIPGDEKLSCCAHIWNLSDDKIINVEANIVSDILSQPWELSQSQFLILKAQE